MTRHPRIAAFAGITALGLLCAAAALSSGTAAYLPCSDAHETLCGDGGPAPSARLLRPLGVATNQSGAVFVADAGNDAVRVISGGIISTYAGIGTPGYSGDGGPSFAAQLDTPNDVSAPPEGGLLIADTGNNVIRRVSPFGRKITTVAGRAPAGTTRTPSTTPAAAASVDLVQPRGVAALSDGFLIADTGANLVLRVEPDRELVVVAGTGAAGYTGDKGPATSARLNAPTRVLPTSDGGFLILDSGNGVVRRVSASGTISTVPGSATSLDHGLFGQLTVNPGGLAEDGSGNLYVFSGRKVIQVSPMGVRTVIAGTGECGSTGDGGQARSAKLATPTGLALDQSGNLLVSDYNNQADAAGNVRLISASGTITTAAGETGNEGCIGAGGSPAGALWPIFYITAPRAARSYRAITVQFLTTRTAMVRTSLLRRGRRVRTAFRPGRLGLNTVTFKRGVASGSYQMEIMATGSVENNVADDPQRMLTLSKRFDAPLRVRR